MGKIDQKPRTEFVEQLKASLQGANSSDEFYFKKDGSLGTLGFFGRTLRALCPGCFFPRRMVGQRRLRELVSAYLRELHHITDDGLKDVWSQNKDKPLNVGVVLKAIKYAGHLAGRNPRERVLAWHPVLSAGKVLS